MLSKASLGYFRGPRIKTKSKTRVRDVVDCLACLCPWLKSPMLKYTHIVGSVYTCNSSPTTNPTNVTFKQTQAYRNKKTAAATINVPVQNE